MYPELLQFRALPGTASALQRLAKEDGKSVAAIVRELVGERLRRAGGDVGMAS